MEVAIIKAGKLLEPNVQHISTDHCEPRRPNTQVDMVVIHCISLPAGNYDSDLVPQLFTGQIPPQQDSELEALRSVRVSAHLFIRRGGEMTQFVNFKDQAWHCGESSFATRTNLNQYSVGIELEGLVHTEFTEEQYVALVSVLRALLAEYPNISWSNIVGHCDIAPTRKNDPGAGFDWVKLRKMVMAD